MKLKYFNHWTQGGRDSSAMSSPPNSCCMAYEKYYSRHKCHTDQLTIETTKMIAMKRLAIPTTLVPALIPNAMDTALMFVMKTKRK